ncbi:hypothetical protein ACIBKZ_09710 [Streptomyces sp. NPDC050421]|uniref:hypothetical protein n=1 Tax=Streptomyces sp. NPDC050421 TaxID=3365613 RepID=UPI0037998219
MRPAAVLLAAAALLALTACSAEDNAKPAPSSSAPTVNHAAAEEAAGIPPAPTGPDRAAYLAAIKKVDARIVEDEEKAIDAGRNQCSSLAGGGNKLDWAAAQRFGNDARPLTDVQGKALNDALRKTLCPAT